MILHSPPARLAARGDYAICWEGFEFKLRVTGHPGLTGFDRGSTALRTETSLSGGLGT